MKILLLIILSIHFVSAQEVVKISLNTEPDFVCGDILGNIYAVKGNDIYKYNSAGTLCCTYSDKTTGEITSVDVRDPLRIVVFYRAFGLVKVLDNRLSEQSSIDLRKLQLVDPFMVCTSDIQGMWVYDNATARLYRFDASMQPVGLSNDLRQEISRMFNPLMMAESDYWLVIREEQNLLVFDKMGNYFKPLPVSANSNGILLHDEWIYPSGNSVKRINIRTGQETEMALTRSGAGLRLFAVPGRMVIAEGKTIEVISE